jgi:hypothetical protein
MERSGEVMTKEQLQILQHSLGVDNLIQEVAEEFAVDTINILHVLGTSSLREHHKSVLIDAFKATIKHTLKTVASDELITCPSCAHLWSKHEINVGCIEVDCLCGINSSSSEYREIHLTKGQVALVDIQDFDRINRFNWYANWNRDTRSFYAARTTKINDKKVSILMHRFIVGLFPGDKTVVDHKNSHDTLDNRRSNLRVTNNENNGGNARLGRNNTSGYKGVTWSRDKNKWCAQISIRRKHIFLGYFDIPTEAHTAYCKAAVEYFGEFSRFK